MNRNMKNGKTEKNEQQRLRWQHTQKEKNTYILKVQSVLGTLVKQLEELNRFKTFKMHVLLDYFSAVCFSRCFRLSDRVSHHRRRRRCRCFCYIVCACRHLCYEKRTKNYCENMYGSLLFTTTLYFFPSCLSSVFIRAHFLGSTKIALGSRLLYRSK